MKIKVNTDKDKVLRLVTGEIIKLKKGINEIEATSLLAERVAKVIEVEGYDKEGNKIKEATIEDKEGIEDDKKDKDTSKSKDKKS